jgi:hypothetical protein
LKLPYRKLCVQYFIISASFFYTLIKEFYMQPVGNLPAQPNGAKIAFRQGLFFGLVLAGVNDILYVLNSVFNQTPTAIGTNSSAVGVSVLIGFVVGCLIFLLDLGAYFGAGILAARQTAKVSTGMLAGLWTGVIYGLVDFIVKIIIQITVTIPATSQYLQPTATPGTGSAQSAANIVGAISITWAFVLMLASIGIGIGLGALGGLIGRNMSKIKRPEQVLVPYPGPMYGMYGQGMYVPTYGAPGQNWQPQPGMPVYPPPLQQVPAYTPQSTNNGYAVPLREPGYQEHARDDDHFQQPNPWPSSLP